MTNQSPDLVDYNLFTSHPALVEALAREGGSAAHERLANCGARFGTAEMFALGDAANRNPPVLKTVDRFGNRRDEVEFHPAWHELMRQLVAEGLHTGPWAQPEPGAHVARAAAYMLWAEVENGTQCPATMTYGAVPVLARQPNDFAEWLPRLLSREYDARRRPIHEKRGALIGMGMTEKQGGSDVRANTSRAAPVSVAGPGREYRLTGHKWFFSAPMCDGFLVLAQAAGGLSCFFMPRVLPDGTLNSFRLQRLKDKVGNRSNASSEIEFHEAACVLVGEEGRGVPTILEMGVYTRLDNAIGSTGIMHQCVAQAIHHCRYRRAFGRLLIDQPLMRNVLADLALECEAATVFTMRLARAFDRQQDEVEAALRRVLTPVAKYWICKRAPLVATEAMEVLGGNGYVEEGPIARRFREAPLNSIWEGSGNVMCLDVLRALSRDAPVMEALLGLLRKGQGKDPRYDRYVSGLASELTDSNEAEVRARRSTERIALAVQAAILLEHDSPAAEAFLASRIARDAPGAFGTLPVGLNLGALIERALAP
ncbi:MAG TPA: isovaleryl-CoA dehydrogenase [Steroidobacteraceae bacterium]|jgi:putative acyl-CoA dehydrogenase|nr:isovaleryl-CoA dehydrogenase [Steroidobacteraceae bacterium]